jgi:hypothetical protein
MPSQDARGRRTVLTIASNGDPEASVGNAIEAEESYGSDIRKAIIEMASTIRREAAANDATEPTRDEEYFDGTIRRK